MKRLIVCLDGTWNKPDQEEELTNVVKIMRALNPSDETGIPQIAFYDMGVGTGGFIDRMRGGALGRGLEDNIKDGYRFLANNYAPGDEIYLFGFSRGAFTARSLAGFIGWHGLIKKTELHQLGEVWNRYKERSKGEKEAPEKIRNLGTSVRIKCIGVWDTVGALGIPTKKIAVNFLHRKYEFHDTGLGDHIDHAFHALAIDEKRGPFEPTLWSIENEKSESMDRVQQVWFPGAHSNVGGGYKETQLSDIALTWMIGRVGSSTGLSFEDSYTSDTGHINPNALGPHHDSLGWYPISRMLPFHRVIGNRCHEKVSWLSRMMNRFNKPKEGRQYVNEMIHRSALDRLGKQVPCKKSKDETIHKIYSPDNLQAAAARNCLSIVEADGSITNP